MGLGGGAFGCALAVGLGRLGSAAAGLVVGVERFGAEEGKLLAALAKLGGLVPGRCGGAITLAVRPGS